jgi:hypothetical protein
MVKAGALYYAIFISFLVALLGGFFIMNVWLHHAHTLVILNGQRLQRNVSSALLLAQETPGLVPENSSLEVDLFKDGNDKVIIRKTLWGGYCLLMAEAQARFVKKSAIELCGKDVFENEKTALYLADIGQCLSLSGKTIIKGDCYLPKSGVRSTYIEGTSFSGSRMTVGNVKNSKKQLPSVNNFMIKSNLQYFNGQGSVSDSLADINLLLKNDTLKRSFYKNTLLLSSSKWITLSNKVLRGNIRIVSSKGVTITKSVQTNDIIVYAPKIEIEKGFSGSVQLFATDTILINDGVRLLFPSFLAVPETQNTRAFISIGKGCDILGDILLTTKDGIKNSRLECLVSTGSVITGRVYCEGRLELRGEADGTVYTNGFILRTPGSIYENQLLDATINFDALPVFYSGSLINEGIERYKIVKWLN